MKRRSIPWLWILVAVLIVLPSVAWQPPSDTTGSSYRRTPDGYAAWMEWMEQQGSPVQRWRSPYERLTEQPQPMTLIQVYGQGNQEGSLTPELRRWVEQGNHVLVLGRQEDVTAAPFAQSLQTPLGPVQIHTSRRAEVSTVDPADILLADEFGLVAWRRSIGEGQVTWVITPFLAANAYLSQPAHFALLRHWVNADGGSVWIDEYLHGYRDPETLATAEGSVWTYLASTPWLIVALQAGLLLLLAIWGHNRRFGQPLPQSTPATANTEAYVSALAAVLEKAHQRQFVLEQWATAERRWLQQHLGLGSQPVDAATLLTAWTAQTGRPAQELQPMLHWMALSGRSGSPSRPPSATDLTQWIHQVDRIHHHLRSPDANPPSRPLGAEPTSGGFLPTTNTPKTSTPGSTFNTP
ncbi:MAG: DUF4350 domain-containing protein [Synechococcales cyanobacterium]